MSGDEVLIGIAAGIVAAAYWGGWLTAAARTSPLVHAAGRLMVVVLVLLASLGLVVAALLTGADPQVRSSLGYILLFVAVAGAALAGATVAGSAFGLPALDGYIREKNTAVGWAAAGLWLGTGLVNAGANVGRGDTIYTTLGPLALGMVTLLVLVGILAATTGGFRAVRLDRDGPAGVRLAGLFIAWGLILGRAVAGDWESTRQTLEDFSRYAAAAAYLLMGAAIVELALRPTMRRPRTRSWLWGIGPAAGYVIPAVGVALT